MAGYSPSRTVLGGSVRILDDGVMAFGSALATASQVEPDTTQTPDGLVLWLSTTWGRNLILADLAAKGDDYALAASTHPTLAVFSATRASVSTTQYVFIQHNATNGVIRTGTGAILLQPNGDTDDYFSFETLTNIPTIKGVGSYVRIGDAVTSGIFASAEDDLAVTGVFEIANTVPAIYISETDQVDPAGRYRLGSTADGFVIEREQAASFANALGSATNFVFLQYDRSNTVYGLDAYEGNAWYVRIQAGAAATSATNSRLTVGGSTAALTGVRITTGDGVAGMVERIAFLQGAATTDIDIGTAQLDMNGQVLKGLATVRGQGTGDVNFIANKAATDATARNFGFYLLDPATDTETLLVQFTANALTPTIDLQDDLLLRIGTTGDTGIANVSAGLAANTASAGTLEGTVVNPIALAANSLVIGNITNDGDVLIAVSKAGNSHMAFMADGSTGDTLLGAPTGQSIDGYIAGTKILDVAANLLTYEAAAGASNQRILVSNTSNTAATSEHAIIEASVGGTTTIGHPQVRWTITGGTSWYAGPQNNDSDIFKIGTGASLGSAAYLAIDGRTSGVAANLQFTFNTNNLTASDGATAGTDVVRIAAHTVTLAGATTVTSFHAMLDVRAMTINQSGGAVTVNEAAGIGAFTVTAGASVTLTHSSAFRARTGGAAVNLSGYYAEAQTAGTTGNYQMLLAVSTGAAPALADHVGITARDFAADDTRLYIASQAGSDIILGNNTVRATWATQAVADATVDLGIVNGTTYSLVRITSSLRHKVVLNQWTLDTKAIYRLPLSDWESRAGDYGRRGYSPIAEWARDAYPAFAQLDEGGEPIGINWNNLNTAVLAEVQSHETRLVHQENRITRLERQLRAAGIVPEE